MKELIVSFFQDYGIALQTITSMFLLVVTVIYVTATFKMLHSSHKSFLRPLKVKGNELTVKNFGPGIAINIKLFLNSKYTKEIDPNKDPTGMLFEIFKDRYFLVERETFELEANHSISFIFDEETIRLNKILLYWETITGERMLIRFKIKVSNNGQINITHYKRLRFKSIKNMILIPLQFIDSIISGGSMGPTFEQFLEQERKKKEKESKKWLI